MSRFIHEPEDGPLLVPVDQLPPPITWNGVLTDLKVSWNAPLEQRRAAVLRWLADNEPSEALRWSLEREGLPIRAPMNGAAPAS